MAHWSTAIGVDALLPRAHTRGPIPIAAQTADANERPRLLPALVLLTSPTLLLHPPSTKLQTLRSSLAAADAERLGLENRFEEALRRAETTSRDAAAEAETLTAGLEASGREVAAAAEERREYGAEMEVLYTSASALP